jgi:hypothetical protein
MSSDNKPKDPIVEKIEQARERRKAEADVAAGEKALAGDFQQQANKNGKAELDKIEALLNSRCGEINASGADPAFEYYAETHTLRAGNFALRLEVTEGYSPYFFDMISGLRRDAAQVFIEGFEPDYEATNWRFLAQMDESGFFWDCDGDKYSNERIVEEGLEALAANVGRQ